MRWREAPTQDLTWNRFSPALLEALLPGMEQKAVLVEDQRVDGIDGVELLRMGCAVGWAWHRGALLARISLPEVVATQPLALVQQILEALTLADDKPAPELCGLRAYLRGEAPERVVAAVEAGPPAALTPVLITWRCGETVAARRRLWTAARALNDPAQLCHAARALRFLWQDDEPARDCLRP